MAKKTCFMVMPFGVKATGLKTGEGPQKVDFDALWNKALRPVIEELGFVAIRADQDIDAMIVHGMIERLAYADLVLADVSIANANVYYELGLRHAARKQGCVLIAAKWAKPLFDIQPMRRATSYLLKTKSVSDADAKAIRESLLVSLPPLLQMKSPFFEYIKHEEVTPGDFKNAGAFERESEVYREMLGRIRAVRHIRGDEARAAALVLQQELQSEKTVQAGLLDEMIELLRDKGTWEDVLSYVGTLPAEERRRPWVEEQRLLALSKSGDVAAAIGALLQLVEVNGESAEVCGLLGGRFKKKMRACAAAADSGGERSALNDAIDWYQRGMNADLNAYYPSSNLPLLLVKRNRKEDAERARRTAAVVVAAVERALEMGVADEWARPSLLVSAFIAQEPDKAAELAERVADEGIAGWKLDTVLDDLRDAVTLVKDAAVLARLSEVLGELESLVGA